MNVVTNLFILTIVTLVVSRHVHAYRIAKRRRGGGRTTNRQSTSDSSDIPPCDPCSCCSPLSCLRNMLFPDKSCITQENKQQHLTPKLVWEQPESSWPSYKTDQFTDTKLNHLRLEAEQEILARMIFDRFFLGRGQSSPVLNDFEYEGTGQGEMEVSKRTTTRVCPADSTVRDVRLTVDAGSTLEVDMEELGGDDRKQWVLDETCLFSRSPILNDVSCQQQTRTVRVLVRDASSSLQVPREIQVNCCVAVQTS